MRTLHDKISARRAALAALVCLAAGLTACYSTSPEFRGGHIDNEHAERIVSPNGTQTDIVKEGEPDRDALPFEARGPVARVNGEEVPAALFNKVARKLRVQMPDTPAPEVVFEFRDRALETCIREYLLDRRLDQAGVTVDEARVEAAFERFESSFDGEADFEAFLADNDLTRAQLRDDVRDQLRLELFLAREFDVEVTRADARAYYEENAHQFRRDGTLMPFAEVERRIHDALKKEAYRKEAKRFLDELAGTAQIERIEDNITVLFLEEEAELEREMGG